jgi:hypothetical protein
MKSKVFLEVSRAVPWEFPHGMLLYICSYLISWKFLGVTCFVAFWSKSMLSAVTDVAGTTWLDQGSVCFLVPTAHLPGVGGCVTDSWTVKSDAWVLFFREGTYPEAKGFCVLTLVFRGAI